MRSGARRAWRGAAVVSLVLGIGFGVPCAVGLVHLARTGEVWQFLGFPTYGGGPFEKVGIATTVPLMATFLFVCLAETVLAGLLWTDHPVAGRMSHALLPVELVFWIGFALPVGPPLGLARSGLVVLAAASAGGGEEVSAALADHDHGGVDVVAGDAGHHRGVGDA